MKLFIAIALIATVASAAVVRPAVVSGELAELQEIVAAINSPSTNPATAAALEQMLLDVLGLKPEPIAVGPAIIEASPIAVGPAIIEPSPIAVGPAIIDALPEPVATPAPAAADASPALVQIIVNVNQPAAESVAAPTPAVVPEADAPWPIHIVDSAPDVVDPVQVVEVAPVVVDPVQVVEIAPVVVDPVQVVENAPVVPVEPVIIGTPVIPNPAVALPEELN